MHSLKDLLSGNIRRNHAERGVRAVLVLDACREALEAVLPPKIADKVKPISYKNGVIALSAPHPAIASEIRLYQGRIIALIEERRGGGVVKFLRIQVGWQSEADVIR